VNNSPAASTNASPRRGIRRQQRSIEEKRRIVEARLVAERSISEVAQAHGVPANQVFKWRRLYRDGRLNSTVDEATLLPVQIAESGETVTANLPGCEFRAVRFRSSFVGRVSLSTAEWMDGVPFVVAS
jgi:transposase-like protein